MFISVDIDSARENVPVYNAPQSWGPVDPSSQIGLLSALFRRLQSVPDGMIEVCFMEYCYLYANLYFRMIKNQRQKKPSYL